MSHHNRPETLLEDRLRALAEGDYGKVYDSYHPDAPFLEHFADRADYLAFAGQQLTTVRVTAWRIVASRPATAGAVEVILSMRVMSPTGMADLHELALLIPSVDGWRYHSAQKLSGDEFAGATADIDFTHFDLADPKVRF